MAEMPIDPRLAKCLLASASQEYCNASNANPKDRDTEGNGKKDYDTESNVVGCTEEMLSIAAMCSVDYPFIPLKAKASDERKEQRLGTHTCLIYFSASFC